jgi:hypothetical protein
MSQKMAPFLTLVAASFALTFASAGCNKSAPDNTAQTQSGAAPANQTQDPAASANLAPVAAQPATYDQQAPNSNYQQAPNNSNNDSRNYSNRDSRSRDSRDYRNRDSRDYPDSGNYNEGNYNDSGSYDDSYDNVDDTYGQPVIYASDPPPPLPEYSQPECPGDGYIWTPGYWSWSSEGYYWVPGAWARAPEVGYLWTPGWWGFSSHRYRYHNGYWGRHIATTAALTTVTATPVPVIRAVIGMETASNTTAPSTTWMLARYRSTTAASPTLLLTTPRLTTPP